MYNAGKNNINWLDLIDKNEYFDSIRTLPLSQIFYISSINPENFNDIAYNNWKNIILQLFEKDTFINGEKTSAEDFITGTLKSIGREIFTDWIEKLYFDSMNFSNYKIGILHTISHMDYQKIYPAGQYIALTGLTDPNDEVIEYSIKAFENWNIKNSAELLKGRQLKKQWLQNYLEDVTKYLEEL